MTHRLLILGADGQLGRAFVQLLTEQDRSFLALGRGDIDLAEPKQMNLPLQDVSAVINCAAYTNVDGAEDDEETARIVNGDAVGALAKICQTSTIPLVHFSTDYVFSGHAATPYSVGEMQTPLGAYGRTKALGERLLLQAAGDHLLVRTSWVYAPWGNNFVLTMARLVKSKPELKVVNDQRGRPTHVLGLAERTLALLDGDHRGTFHITDGGECTWFEFAEAIKETIGVGCLIHPCTTEEFPRPAKRPAYSVLDTSAADELLGPPIHYRERLTKMKTALEDA